SRPPAEAAPPTPPRPATSPARPAALGESGHAGLKTPVKDRCSVSRSRESPEERQARLAKGREAKSAARAKESAEAKEARLAKDRARRRAREQENPQIRENRQEKKRESRAKESAEAKEARLAKQRARRRAAKEQESDQERDAKSAEKRRQMRLHRAQTAKRAKRVLFSVSQEESSCGDASDSDSTDWSSHSDGCQLEDDVSDCDAYGEATNGYRTLDPNDPAVKLQSNSLRFLK
ncbi:uncharacterized protein LOC127748884, partial [Frankliniella occidentalis]|uniref:Uncharacterized protein LOC127748884 n=1 Tax=Frankliniella occidentalis TaxID=133901 RepID=A0A9C6TPI3_FRAOC